MRAILTYHSIDGSGSVVSVDATTFAGHARWLASGAVQPTDVEGVSLEDGRGEERIAVTFDDGFRNFATAAWPVLREHGIPVTLFVVSGRAGSTNSWGGAPADGVPELPLLDWEELGRLAEEGVELASHSRRHRRLAGLDPDRLEEEVAGSAEEIEARTGRRPAGFAYPYGVLDAAAREAVRRHYRWACTTELRPVVPGREDPHALPRLDAYYFRHEGRLAAWGTPRFRARLRLRRLARETRRALAPGGADG